MKKVGDTMLKEWLDKAGPEGQAAGRRLPQVTQATRTKENPAAARRGLRDFLHETTLDLLYDGAAWLAALFMIGLLVMVLLSIVSRQLDFHVPGTDAYAGYMMAAAGFLALAHTLKRGEHIRVTLLLAALKGRAQHALELWALSAAVAAGVAVRLLRVRLAWQSHVFNDISTGNDATPLWIPQLAMAVGTVILLIAFVDELVLELRGRRASRPAPRSACAMNDVAITALLIVALFAILGSGVWIGLTLSGVAWIGMQLFSSRPAGDAMAVTIWGSSSSWTLTALPLFVWMGEILFRTRLSQDMFRGLAPWMQALPGRLLHINVVGCAIFAAVSGSSAATCATIGKMTLPELGKRGYPDDIIDRLAGRRRHAGPADPAVDHHDRLRRRRRRVDRAAVHRRRPARHAAGRAVLGLSGGLGAAQPQTGPACRRADATSAEAVRVAAPDPGGRC